MSHGTPGDNQENGDDDQLYDILNLLPPMSIKHIGGGISSGFNSPEEYKNMNLGFQQYDQVQHQQQKLNDSQSIHQQMNQGLQDLQLGQQVQDQGSGNYQVSQASSFQQNQTFDSVPTFNIDSNQGIFNDSPNTQTSTTSLPPQIQVNNSSLASGDLINGGGLTLNTNNLQQLNTQQHDLLQLLQPNISHHRGSSYTSQANSVYSDVSLNAASPYMDAMSHFSDAGGNPPNTGTYFNSFDQEIALGGSILSTNLQQYGQNLYQLYQQQGQGQSPIPFHVPQQVDQQQLDYQQLQKLQQPQAQQEFTQQWNSGNNSDMLTENNLSKFQTFGPKSEEVIINIDAAPEVEAANRTPSLFSNSSHNSSTHNSPGGGLKKEHHSSTNLLPGGSPGGFSDYSDSLRPEEYQMMKRGRRRAHLVRSGASSGRSRSRSSYLSEDDRSDFDDASDMDEDRDDYDENESGRGGKDRVSSREKMLELASPNQPSKRTQKHPSVYACHLCEKRFTRPYNLKSHLRTHTDERPFICSVCGKAFARQHDRKRHEDLHTGEKKFQCKGLLKNGEPYGCGRKFARADALRRHFQTEAGKECIRLLVEEDEKERLKYGDLGSGGIGGTGDGSGYLSPTSAMLSGANIPLVAISPPPE